jgi:hypothetical protein
MLLYRSNDNVTHLPFGNFKKNILHYFFRNIKKKKIRLGTSNIVTYERQKCKVKLTAVIVSTYSEACE